MTKDLINAQPLHLNKTIDAIQEMMPWVQSTMIHEAFDAYEKVAAPTVYVNDLANDLPHLTYVLDDRSKEDLTKAQDIICGEYITILKNLQVSLGDDRPLPQLAAMIAFSDDYIEDDAVAKLLPLIMSVLDPGAEIVLIELLQGGAMDCRNARVIVVKANNFAN